MNPSIFYTGDKAVQLDKMCVLFTFNYERSSLFCPQEGARVQEMNGSTVTWVNSISNGFNVL